MRKNTILFFSISFWFIISGGAPGIGFADDLSMPPSAPNNTVLSSVSTASYPSVVRFGYATAGDAAPLTFFASASPCSLNNGAGDGGSQVKSASGGCWLAYFPSSGADFREWGVQRGTDVTAALQAAVNWAVTTRSKLVIHYCPSCYNLSSTIEIGNGSPTAFATNTPATIEGDVASTEQSSPGGTILPTFNWTQTGGTVFQVNGPLANLTLKNLSVFCQPGGCSPGFHITNSLDSVYENLAVFGAKGGPAFIIDSIPVKTGPPHAGQEGSLFNGLWSTYPLIGGSGLQYGSLTGGSGNWDTDDATISNTLMNVHFQYDCSTPGTFGINLGFAAETTFLHPRVVCGWEKPSGTQTAMIVSPTSGGGLYPTDMLIIQPEFTGSVADPGSSWNPTDRAGVEFQHYNTYFGSVPHSTTPGAFWGTDFTGSQFGAPVTIPFTPTLMGSTAIGSQTYFLQAGSYIKNGTMVTVRFYLLTTALDSAMAGNVQVAFPGLPPNVDTSTNSGTCFLSTWGGVSLDSGYYTLAGELNPGSTIMNLAENSTSNSSAFYFKAIPVSHLAPGVSLRGECTYQTE